MCVCQNTRAPLHKTFCQTFFCHKKTLAKSLCKLQWNFFFCRSFLIFAVKNSGKKFYATGPRRLGLYVSSLGYDVNDACSFKPRNLGTLIGKPCNPESLVTQLEIFEVSLTSSFEVQPYHVNMAIISSG